MHYSSSAVHVDRRQLAVESLHCRLVKSRTRSNASATSHRETTGRVSWSEDVFVDTARRKQTQRKTDVKLRVNIKRKHQHFDQLIKNKR